MVFLVSLLDWWNSTGETSGEEPVDDRLDAHRVGEDSGTGCKCAELREESQQPRHYLGIKPRVNNDGEAGISRSVFGGTHGMSTGYILLIEIEDLNKK